VAGGVCPSGEARKGGGAEHFSVFGASAWQVPLALLGQDADTPAEGEGEGGGTMVMSLMAASPAPALGLLADLLTALVGQQLDPPLLPPPSPPPPPVSARHPPCVASS
jgi:hypothetical protein